MRLSFLLQYIQYIYGEWLLQPVWNYPPCCYEKRRDLVWDLEQVLAMRPDNL